MKITKEVKTGFVVIVTLISFYALFNFLKGKNLFSRGNTYYVMYNDVSGLLPSKAVTVNGLRIGRVDEIKIIDNISPIYFVATLKLDRKINFSKNTIAEIYEPGIMSGAEVRLLLDYKGDQASSGDTLKGTLTGGLTDALSKGLGPTKEKLDSLLITFNSTMQSVEKLLDDENKQSLKQALKSLDKTLISFDHTAQSLTKTSDNANQMIVDNSSQLKSTLASTQQTMEKFGTVADKVNNLELEKIIQNFEQASAKLNVTLDNINNNKGSLGAFMNDRELYDNLNNTSKKLDELILDLKENPNRYVQFSIFGKKTEQPK